MNATAAKLFDAEAVAEAIRLIAGDGVTELRALDATTKSDRWPHTISGYFDDPTKCGIIEMSWG